MNEGKPGAGQDPYEMANLIGIHRFDTGGQGTPGAACGVD